MKNTSAMEVADVARLRLFRDFGGSRDGAREPLRDGARELTRDDGREREIERWWSMVSWSTGGPSPPRAVMVSYNTSVGRSWLTVR